MSGWFKLRSYSILYFFFDLPCIKNASMFVQWRRMQVNFRSWFSLEKSHWSAEAKDMGLSPMLRIWCAPLQFDGCDHCWPNWFQSGNAIQWISMARHGTAFTWQWFQCFEVRRVSSHFAIMTRHSCLLRQNASKLCTIKKCLSGW